MSNLTLNGLETSAGLPELRRMIMDGRLPLNSRLPPERELAVQLGVGRTVLRKSLAQLEAEGMISRKVGRGTYVGSTPPQLSHAQTSIIAVASPWETLVARLMFEPAIASIAASHATPQHIEVLRNCIDRLRTTDGLRNRAAWDITFHKTIAIATGNAIMIDLLERVATVRASASWRALQSDPSPKEREELVDQHFRILDAIERRSPADAARAMREHLLSVRGRLFPLDAYEASQLSSAER